MTARRFGERELHDTVKVRPSCHSKRCDRGISPCAPHAATSFPRSWRRLPEAGQSRDSRHCKDSVAQASSAPSALSLTSYSLSHPAGRPGYIQWQMQILRCQIETIMLLWQRSTSLHIRFLICLACPCLFLPPRDANQAVLAPCGCCALGAAEAGPPAAAAQPHRQPLLAAPSQVGAPQVGAPPHLQRCPNPRLQLGRRLLRCAVPQQPAPPRPAPAAAGPLAPPAPTAFCCAAA